MYQNTQHTTHMCWKYKLYIKGNMKTKQVFIKANALYLLKQISENCSVENEIGKDDDLVQTKLCGHVICALSNGMVTIKVMVFCLSNQRIH